MTEVGSPRLGKHRKRQRVAGMSHSGVVLQPHSRPPRAEELPAADAYWRRFDGSPNFPELGRKTLALPTQVDQGEEGGGLKAKPGNRIVLQYTGPFTGWDSLTIPLVCEAARMASVGRRIYEGAFGAELILWARVASPPVFILRWVPEGAYLPTGVSPEPYKYWWEHDQRLDDVIGGSGGEPAFGIIANEPPGEALPFIIPVTQWVGSPWLLDSLLVGEGNCVPVLTGQGQEEKELIEKYEEENGGPVEPGQIALTNAVDLADFNIASINIGEIEGYYSELQKLYKQQEENLYFKEPTKANEENGSRAELEVIEKEIKELEKELHKTPYEQTLNREKPSRKTKGPWMNGVRKFGYRINLKKPAMFPGIDLTKAKGTLVLEVAAVNPEVAFLHPNRLVGGHPIAGGWSYTWPMWESFSGPLGVSRRGAISGPVQLAAGGAGEPGSVDLGVPRLGKIHS